MLALSAPAPELAARRFDVLRELSHLQFVSGEAVARRLGCSRATVSNAIRAAAQAGLPVHAVHGRGYRLARPVSWLDPVALRATFARRGIEFRFFDQLASTNAHLLAWAQEGAPHRALVCAEWQSRGRGRRGREWHAGLGGALTFSLLWRSPRAASRLAGLSLAVGVILTRVLRDMGLAAAMVKWPNDIQVGEGKLAGVLIELAGDVLGPSSAVIGVGINAHGGDELSHRLGREISDLGAHLGPRDRNALLLAATDALDEGLARFEAEGFAAFRDEWQACHAHQGRLVELLQADGAIIAGRALGVDEQGALLLEMDGATRAFHSGELSLRAAGA